MTFRLFDDRNDKVVWEMTMRGIPCSEPLEKTIDTVYGEWDLGSEYICWIGRVFPYRVGDTDTMDDLGLPARGSELDVRLDQKLREEIDGYVDLTMQD